MKRFLILLPLLAVIISCSQKHILFERGTSEYSIVIAQDAPESEQYAALELQTWLKEVGGVSLPIVGLDDGAEGKRLIVGYNHLVEILAEGSQRQSAIKYSKSPRVDERYHPCHHI